MTDSHEVITNLPRHSAELGVERVVAVGGDDTVHRVVMGLFNNGQLVNPETHLAILPIGSGNDFSMTIGMEPEYDEMIDHLVEGTPNTCDVGIVEYSKNDDTTETAYFLNWRLSD